MKIVIHSGVAVAMLITSLLSFAEEGKMKMPPRMVGAFSVDEATMAPLQIKKSAHFKAEPNVVFSALADARNWSKWMPGLMLVSSEGTGVDTKRVWKMGEMTVEDRFISYDADKLIAYSVGEDNPFGLMGHVAVLATIPTEMGGTVLEWHQYFGHEDADTLSMNFDKSMSAALDGMISQFGGMMQGTAIGSAPVMITSSRPISASKDKVWELAAVRLGEVSEWASTVSHAETNLPDGKVAVGAERGCNTAFGMFKETVVTFDEAKGLFGYRVEGEGMPPFVTNAVNTWTIEPMGADRSVLTMNFVIEIAPGTPPPAVGFVKGAYAGAVETSIEEFAFWVENGKAHPRKLSANKAAQQ
ncbi:MAG: SRPBCC family protein [Verrucomicrobiota bacterium]